MFDRKVINEIEDVFVAELGSGSSIIIDENLREMGLSRETFAINNIDEFIDNLLKEYNKVLGTHTEIIKSEIEKRFYD